MILLAENNNHYILLMFYSWINLVLDTTHFNYVILQTINKLSGAPTHFRAATRRSSILAIHDESFARKRFLKFGCL